MNETRWRSLPDAQQKLWQSRTVYFGEIGFTIAMAIFLMARSTLPARDLAPLFVSGCLAWTLAEYAAHRFVLHDLAPTEHSRHHAAPNEPVIHVFWQIWVALILVYVIVGGLFLSGVLIAYAWYLFAHYAAHHSPTIFPKALAKHHLDHHKLSTKNFGVSTTLWDRVFGTMFRGSLS